MAEEAERERHRPTCASCGQKFSDGRWRRVEEQAWGATAYPKLCDACERRAVDEEQQALEAAERAAAEAAAQQATRRGLFSRRA